MADNLNYNESRKQYAFATVKEDAWHHKGQIVANKMTSKEAIIAANLDYEVFKANLYTGDGLRIETHFANIRKDTNDILGVVGKNYSILQNTECFEFFDNVIGEGQAVFETAGALGKGEIIFITAKLEGVLKIIGDNSPIENYICFMSSHNSTYPVTAFFTGIRVVCNNTLNAAMNKCINKITIRHTLNAKSKFDQAAKVMGLNTEYTNTLQEALNHLSSIPISDRRAKELISRSLMSHDELKALVTDNNVDFSIRKNNMIKEIYHYYMTADNIDPIRGNAYGLYNGITGFYQNQKSFKDDDKKMLSIIDGYAYNHQNRMFSLLQKE